MNFPQVIFDGVLVGLFYALVAIGFVIVFRVSGVFNFAHPAFMLVGAMLYDRVVNDDTWAEFAKGIAFSIVVTAILSALVYPFIMRSVSAMPHFVQMVVTFGVSIVVLNLSQYFLGSTTRHPHIPISQTPISLPFNIRTNTLNLVWFGVGLVTCLALAWVASRSSLGIRVRAIAEDISLASYSGIRVPVIMTLVWAIAGGLAAVAGVAYGSRIQIDASMLSIGLAAFPAAMLGGMDSPGGVVVGGIILGVVQTLGAALFGSAIALPLGFVVMFVFLLVLPQGLFGNATVKRI